MQLSPAATVAPLQVLAPITNWVALAPVSATAETPRSRSPVFVSVNTCAAERPSPVPREPKSKEAGDSEAAGPLATAVPVPESARSCGLSVALSANSEAGGLDARRGRIEAGPNDAACAGRDVSGALILDDLELGEVEARQLDAADHEVLDPGIGDREGLDGRLRSDRLAAEVMTRRCRREADPGRVDLREVGGRMAADGGELASRVHGVAIVGDGERVDWPIGRGIPGRHRARRADRAKSGPDLAAEGGEVTAGIDRAVAGDRERAD